MAPSQPTDSAALPVRVFHSAMQRLQPLDAYAAALGSDAGALRALIAARPDQVEPELLARLAAAHAVSAEAARAPLAGAADAEPFSAWLERQMEGVSQTSLRARTQLTGPVLRAFLSGKALPDSDQAERIARALYIDSADMARVIVADMARRAGPAPAAASPRLSAPPAASPEPSAPPPARRRRQPQEAAAPSDGAAAPPAAADPAPDEPAPPAPAPPRSRRRAAATPPEAPPEAQVEPVPPETTADAPVEAAPEPSAPPAPATPRSRRRAAAAPPEAPPETAADAPVEPAPPEAAPEAQVEAAPPETPPVPATPRSRRRAAAAPPDEQAPEPAAPPTVPAAIVADEATLQLSPDEVRLIRTWRRLHPHGRRATLQYIGSLLVEE